jgi:predicted RNA-binding Zn ribbon-like protein
MATRAGQSPLSPPDAVDQVLAFVNTNNGGLPERFADAAGLRSWLDDSYRGDQSEVADVGDVTDADAAAARELRDALLSLMLAHAGDEDTTSEAIQRAERYLSRVAARYPLEPVVGIEGVSLRAGPAGIDGVFATVLAGVTELARAGTWPRLKACRNSICHVAFFDRSRNGSGVYHASTCASMVSMRAYRERRKSESEQNAD